MSSPARPSVFGFMTSGRRRLTFVWLVWMTRVSNGKHVKHSVGAGSRTLGLGGKAHGWKHACSYSIFSSRSFVFIRLKIGKVKANPAIPQTTTGGSMLKCLQLTPVQRGEDVVTAHLFTFIKA